MRACHYIIENILENWGDIELVKEQFEKFAERYPEDREFQDIYNEFLDYLELSKQKLEKIRMEVHNLENMKKKNPGMKGNDSRKKEDPDQLPEHAQLHEKSLLSYYVTDDIMGEYPHYESPCR